MHMQCSLDELGVEWTRIFYPGKWEADEEEAWNGFEYAALVVKPVWFGVVIAAAIAAATVGRSQNIAPQTNPD